MEILRVKPEDMANPRYEVVVRPYALGQLRIQIQDTTVPAWGVPGEHDIVAEA